MKKYVIAMALLLLIAVFGLPATADYAFDGFQLNTSSTGTVYGGVYVGVGDHDAVSENNPCLTNYTLPDTADPVWARVYVDAWGGTEAAKGWVNLSFNNGPWQSVFYNATNDSNSNCWGTGHGVVWVWFDETNNVTPGINRVTATSTIYGADIIRVVLVCAYNDTDGCGHLTNYWVNDGNYNLHYNGTETPNDYDVDNTTTWFNGTAFNASAGGVCRPVSCAKLTTVYHASGGGAAGIASEPDYLYFNVIPTLINHSPYYHLPNQLGDDGNNQYGVEWGDDDYADGAQFTLKSTDITCLLNATNNSATFWRGHDDNDDGWIYHDANYSISTNAEGEAYLHPCIAVLTVNTTTVYAERNMVSTAYNHFGLPLMDSERVDTALSSLNFPTPSYVQRYNSTTGAWEVCILISGQVDPGSEFTMLDPVRGYKAKPSAGTLTWTSE